MFNLVQDIDSSNEINVEARLRPLAMLMACLALAISALLVTTASLGASPLVTDALVMIP